jgi:DNA-binding HxlR family transcriptional regulator
VPARSAQPTEPERPAEPEQPGVHRCDNGLVQAFSVLGKRWNGMILGTLSSSAGSFSELRRGLAPITDSVLSDRLNELVEAGLVSRCVSDGRPPGVRYALSDAGTAIVPILDQLARWATDHLSPTADEDC